MNEKPIPACDDYFVIDAVVHAFDGRKQNTTGRYGELFLESLYDGQARWAPDGYALTRSKFFQPRTAIALESAMFVESETDIACYHPIPAWGIVKDLSPASVGLEIRERFPHRMLLYGAVSPLEGTKAITDLEYQVSEWDIDGLKLYPVDIVDGELRTLRMSDERVMYPVLERCRELGVRTVAVHKSLPIGTAPMDSFHPGDVDYAAADFPDLNFEIVHGGYTFLEETTFQVARFDNIFVNLESTAALLIKRPWHFAKILGELIQWGGAEKIFWGTGSIPHPAPLIDAFRRFQMPAELCERYGYSEITDGEKTEIFAGNFARVHGLDLGAIRREIQDDELSKRRAAGGVPPWGLVLEPPEPDPLALAER